jgi:hypothetical protein
LPSVSILLCSHALCNMLTSSNSRRIARGQNWSTTAVLGLQHRYAGHLRSLDIGCRALQYPSRPCCCKRFVFGPTLSLDPLADMSSHSCHRHDSPLLPRLQYCIHAHVGGLYRRDFALRYPRPWICPNGRSPSTYPQRCSHLL